MLTSDSEPSLSPTALEQLAEVVEKFDRAWQVGTPRLEDYLGGLDEPHSARDVAERLPLRTALFAELLGVEIEYRRRRGETPQPEDYQIRFPAAACQIEVACQPEQNREHHHRLTKTRSIGVNHVREEPAGATAIPGDKIGPYVIERELGRGGMGIVYLVGRPGPKDRAALKTLLSPYTTEHAVRFHREAQAASTIVSDHVVKIFAVGEFDGCPYFVMPYIEGGSFHDLLKAGPFDSKRAARLLGPVARALHELHQEGVLHRDLKPSNILYDRAHDRALLTDFGLAKFERTDSAESDLQLTRADQCPGTPNYMAPEQTDGAEKVTATADIYGLGATLYHMISGQPRMALSER